MGWRDQLQDASFRGAPFFVDAHEATGGRDAIVFKYPNGGVYVEDLGAGERRFEIKAYILGPDYFGARNALMSALQDVQGAGTLIHPYLGALTVEAQHWRMEESRREGGMATFGIDFVETMTSPLMPSAGVSDSDLDASADDAVTSLQGNYIANFQTSLPGGASTAGPSFLTPPLSIPGFSLTSVAQVLVDWTTAVRTAMSPVIHTTKALSTMKSQLDAIVRDSLLLVRTPISLVTRLGIVATSMLEWPDTPRLGITALLAAYGFKTTAPRPLPTTLTRQIERVNQDQVTLLLKGTTIVQASRFAIQAIGRSGRTVSVARRTALVDPPAGYDSYQDAIAVRSGITDAIDALGDMAGDELFASLQQLRADLCTAVPGSPNRLPQLISLTRPVTLPALVLTQQLYGSIALVDDIVARNSIAHPGFVPGGVPLQVLSNV